MAIKNLNALLTKKFANNKVYIWTSVLTLVKKFFGYDFLSGKVVGTKLTIYCPDSLYAHEIYIKRISLQEYININLHKYFINKQISEIKIVNNVI